jgi:hypothetical protein
MKTDDKIIIGYDFDRERIHQLNLNKKEAILNDAFKYCSTFLKELDKEAFKSDFIGVFTASFVERYRSEFPPMLSASKMLELAEVDVKKIAEFQARYDAIKVDANPDFNIYLSGAERIARYEDMQQFTEHLNNLQKHGIKVIPAKIIQGTQHAFTYDFKSQTLKPNIYQL